MTHLSKSWALLKHLLQRNRSSLVEVVFKTFLQDQALRLEGLATEAVNWTGLMVWLLLPKRNVGKVRFVGKCIYLPNC
jgi:hypothetical protein